MTATNGAALPVPVQITNFEASTTPTNPGASVLSLGSGSTIGGGLLRMQQSSPNNGGSLSFDLRFSSAISFSIIASQGGTSGNPSNISSLDRLIFTALDSSGTPLSIYTWIASGLSDGSFNSTGASTTLTSTKLNTAAPFTAFTLATGADVFGVRVNYQTTQNSEPFNSAQFRLEVIPESSTAILMALGAAAIIIRHRSRKRSQYRKYHSNKPDKGGRQKAAFYRVLYF